MGGQERGLRAGIYERVSVKLTGKEARSVLQQHEGNEAACREHSWTIAGHYADPGVSASRYARGRARRRAEYERMRADVAAGLLDVLVFYRVNRADRKLREWADLLEECRDRGVLIYITVGGGHLYDVRNGPDWRQLATEGVAAQSDADQISADVRRGMQDNLKLGKPHGPTPWGYTRLYNEFRDITGQVPDLKTGPIRREIVERVAKGDALTVIARDLERRGVSTPRGGQWTTVSIRSLVRSPTNVAQRRYDPDHTGNGLTTPGAEWWEPLVDEDIWLTACARLERAKRGSPRPGVREHKYLLSYLAQCGKCDGKVGVRRWPTCTIPAYCCWKKGCTGIRHDWLDEYITELAILRMSEPDFYEQMTAGTDGAAARGARAEAVKLRARLEENRRLNIAGRITPASFADIEAGLVPMISTAENRARALATPPALLAFATPADDIRARWRAASVVQRKGVIRELFAYVKILPAVKPGRNTSFDSSRVDWDWR